MLEKNMKSMEDALPLKLKLQSEMRSHFLLSRRFNTLMAIVNERKQEVLEKQSKTLKEASIKLQMDLQKNFAEVYDAQSKEITSHVMRQHDMKVQSLLIKERSHIRENLLELELEELTKPLVSLSTVHQNFIELFTSSLKRFEELDCSIDTIEEFASSSIFKNRANLEAIKFKSMLKRLKGSEQFERSKNQLNCTLTVLSRSVTKSQEKLDQLANIIQESGREAMKVFEFSPDLWNENCRKYQLERCELQQQILNIESDVHNHEKLALEREEELTEIAMMGEVDLQFVETLKAIKKFVLSHQELSVGYLGPVFQYLQSIPEIEQKVWSHISSKVTVILFYHGATARKVHKMMVNEKIRLGPFTLLGIDEFTTKQIASLADNIEGIYSADLLVRKDVKFGKIMKKLLSEVIFVANSESFDTFPSDRVVITSSDDTLTAHAHGYLTFNNTLPKLAELKGISPIQLLQSIYENITELLNVELKISNSNAILTDMKEMQHKIKEDFKSFWLGESEVVCSSLVSLNKLVDITKVKNERKMIYLKDKAMRQVLQEVQDNNFDVDSWNDNELMDMKVQIEENLQEEEEKFKSLEHKIHLDQQQFEDLNEKLETEKKLLLKTFSLMVNQDDDNLKMGIVTHNQKLLTDLEKKLKTVNKQIQQKDLVPFDNSRLKLEIHQIQCGIYQKNSEKSVVNQALLLSQDVVSDEALDSSLYDQFRHESREAILAELTQVRQLLHEQEKSGMIDLHSKETYGHLVESIKKVKSYSETPLRMIVRNKVASKAFPLGNKLVVKLLKDAVHNCQSSFRSITSAFIKSSNLYFYTRGMFESIKIDDFSWTCFEMKQIKALDFEVKWRDEKIRSENLRKLKGLLLIVHIISSMSIFKFVIIDETLFDVSSSFCKFRYPRRSKFLSHFRAWKKILKKMFESSLRRFHHLCKSSCCKRKK